jgi:flagellar L-ring protein precursor FlgH
MKQWIARGMALLLVGSMVIWCDQESTSQSMFELGSGGIGGTSTLSEKKRRPFDVHDQVTVVVNERTRAQTRANLRSDRRSRTEIGIEEFIQFNNLLAGDPRLESTSADRLPLDVELDARQRSDATGRTDREGIFQETIQATVRDVLPNGHLIIEATKSRQINGETEYIKLSGIIDPENVQDGRSIRSAQIADMKVVYDGAGSIGDSQKPGFLSWVLNKLWPF